MKKWGQPIDLNAKLTLNRVPKTLNPLVVKPKQPKLLMVECPKCGYLFKSDSVTLCKNCQKIAEYIKYNTEHGKNKV